VVFVVSNVLEVVEHELHLVRVERRRRRVRDVKPRELLERVAARADDGSGRAQEREEEGDEELHRDRGLHRRARRGRK
jgi:hypothetical protein